MKNSDHNCNNCGRHHDSCFYSNVARLERLENGRNCPMWVPAVQFKNKDKVIDKILKRSPDWIWVVE